MSIEPSIRNDISVDLQQQVIDANASVTPLRVVGGDTKAFYGADLCGDVIDLSPHSGIVNYDPTELVLTVQGGTPLKEIHALLAEQRQMLAFEPPSFGDAATIGGTLACGLSGPRRPYAGAARDFVLGCKILTGKGDIVSFGGEVMKNVAGYDVSRLMVGAMGTLGIILEVSLKVLPLPEEEITLSMWLSVGEALDVMCARAAKPLPLSAASYDGEAVNLRLSGTQGAVAAARRKIAGDVVESGEEYWREVREQQHYFFENQLPLWRLSLAPATLHLPLQGQWFFDWGGALRWLASDMPAHHIRDAVAAEGGHATLFRNKNLYDGEVEVFHPLSPPLMQMQRRLKQVFDPNDILNRDRFYKFSL